MCRFFTIGLFSMTKMSWLSVLHGGKPLCLMGATCSHCGTWIAIDKDMNATQTNKEQTMTNEKTHLEMYTEAMEQTDGRYKGYTDGNALSLWVDEKYSVNAAADPAAHDALIEVLGGE